MKITPERIEEIKAAVVDVGKPHATLNAARNSDHGFIKFAETAIPELLAEREEREGEIERLKVDANMRHPLEHSLSVAREINEDLETRAESLEKALGEVMGENAYRKTEKELVLKILDTTPIFNKDEGDVVTNDVCRVLGILSVTEHADVRAILDGKVTP